MKFNEILEKKQECSYCRDFQPLSQYAIILSELADGEKFVEELIEITGYPSPSVRRCLSELNNENIIHKTNNLWTIT